VAVVTAPGPLPWKAARTHVAGQLRKLRKAAVRVLQPAKPVLANAASIPLTIAGIGCIDAGISLFSFRIGLIVTGLSLMWLEHLIADEQ
jgi:hypothetical protein